MRPRANWMRTTTPGPRPNSSQRACTPSNGCPKIVTDTVGVETAPEPAVDDGPGVDDREPAACAGVVGEPAGLPPERTTAMTAAATAAAATRSSNFGRRRRREVAPSPRSGPASRNSTSSGGTSSPRLMHPLSLACGLSGLLVLGSGKGRSTEQEPPNRSHYGLPQTRSLRSITRPGEPQPSIERRPRFGNARTPRPPGRPSQSRSVIAATEPTSGRRRPLDDGVLHAYCLGRLRDPENRAADPGSPSRKSVAVDHRSV